MTHSKILLNDGSSAILLNDGTSFLILNAEGDVHVSGVDIQGTHPVADLRGIAQVKKKKRIQPVLQAVGQISRFSIFSGSARLFRKNKLSAESKISKVIESRMMGRIWRPTKLWMESMVFSNNKIKLPISDVEKEMKEHLRRIKLRKKLKEFRKEFD